MSNNRSHDHKACEVDVRFLVVGEMFKFVELAVSTLNARLHVPVDTGPRKRSITHNAIPVVMVFGARARARLRGIIASRGACTHCFVALSSLFVSQELAQRPRPQDIRCVCEEPARNVSCGSLVSLSTSFVESVVSLS